MERTEYEGNVLQLAGRAPLYGKVLYTNNAIIINNNAIVINGYNNTNNIIKMCVSVYATCYVVPIFSNLYVSHFVYLCKNAHSTMDESEAGGLARNGDSFYSNWIYPDFTHIRH